MSNNKLERFEKNVQAFLFREGLVMAKNNKSKRFVQQGSDAVKKHDERFPYRERFSDVERKREEADRHTVGGF